jgi:hypothetical protein
MRSRSRGWSENVSWVSCTPGQGKAGGGGREAAVGRHLVGTCEAACVGASTHAQMQCTVCTCFIMGWGALWALLGTAFWVHQTEFRARFFKPSDTIFSIMESAVGREEAAMQRIVDKVRLCNKARPAKPAPPPPPPPWQPTGGAVGAGGAHFPVVCNRAARLGGRERSWTTLCAPPFPTGPHPGVCPGGKARGRDLRSHTEAGSGALGCMRRNLLAGADGRGQEDYRAADSGVSTHARAAWDRLGVFCLTKCLCKCAVPGLVCHQDAAACWLAVLCFPGVGARRQ